MQVPLAATQATADITSLTGVGSDDELDGTVEQPASNTDETPSMSRVGGNRQAFDISEAVTNRLVTASDYRPRAG
jgi:hypothetical protein